MKNSKDRNNKKTFKPEGLDGGRKKRMKPLPKVKYKRYSFDEE